MKTETCGMCGVCKVFPWWKSVAAGCLCAEVRNYTRMGDVIFDGKFFGNVDWMDIEVFTYFPY